MCYCFCVIGSFKRLNSKIAINEKTIKLCQALQHQVNIALKYVLLNAPLLLNGDLSLTKFYRVVLKAITTVIKGKERKGRRRDWFNVTNVRKIHIYDFRKVKECTLNCEANNSSKLRLLLMDAHYLTTDPHYKLTVVS